MSIVTPPAQGAILLNISVSTVQVAIIELLAPVRVVQPAVPDSILTPLLKNVQCALMAV